MITPALFAGNTPANAPVFVSPSATYVYSAPTSRLAPSPPTGTVWGASARLQARASSHAVSSAGSMNTPSDPGSKANVATTADRSSGP